MPRRSVNVGKRTKNLTLNSLRIEKSNKKFVSIPKMIDRGFDEDDTAKRVIGENLKERGTKSSAFSLRAEKVFRRFNPSKFSSKLLYSPNYLGPKDNLIQSQQTLIRKALALKEASNINRSLTVTKLENVEGLETKGSLSRKDSIPASIKLDDVLNFVEPKFVGEQLYARNILTECKLEADAESKINQILQWSKKESFADSVSESDSSSTTDELTNAKNTNSDAIVKQNVGLQMRSATSPETPLLYGFDQSNELDKVHNNIAKFELRSTGPADVTSYHDFHSVQIAFESIWTEIFDNRLTTLGKQLYEEYVKLKEFSGVDDGKDHYVDTVEDLQQLLEEVKTFAQQTLQNISPMQPSGTSGGNPPADGGFTGSLGGAGIAALVGPLLGFEPLTASLMGWAIGGLL